MAVKCHVNVKTEVITGNIYEFSNCCGPSVFLTLFFIDLCRFKSLISVFKDYCTTTTTTIFLCHK